MKMKQLENVDKISKKNRSNTVSYWLKQAEIDFNGIVYHWNSIKNENWRIVFESQIEIFVPKCVPMPKQSILCPCSFKLSIVSSLISFDATIVNVLNHGILKLDATKSNVSRAKQDKYAKSPESIRIPTARYPWSFNAIATAQKFNKPDLIKTMRHNNKHMKFDSLFSTHSISFWMNKMV